MTLEEVSQVFDTKAGPIRAVDDVALSINPGEVLCLVGESGSGKTTAARMAAGLARPSDGQVAFDGNDIWSMKRRTSAPSGAASSTSTRIRTPR